MANALIISKQTGGYFSFNLSINGAVQDEVSSIQNDLLTVGNTLHFKTSNGANIIKQQDITPAELTIIASGTFTFATVTQVWDKLIEIGFFDWLGTGGGSGVDRFDDLLDTFQYFGKDGYVCIVNESQQKLEAVPFYNYRKFTDLEDSPSFLVPNKMVVVNPAGDALILQDQPTTPDTYLNSVGYFDYNDSATHTTPLTFVSNTPLKLTNDTLGANTNTSENPYGVSYVWNSSVNQFDFSQLSIGDTIDIRVQVQVTTTTANQKFRITAKFGIGSVAQFENTILSSQVKTAGLEEISFVAPFYIGSTYIKDFPAELYITSDNGGTVIVDGWYVRILRKNINIITIESSVPDATTLVKGIVRLGGDLSGTSDNPTVPALATKIANTRLISTTAPLTGGGDLSVDRTISIPQANTSTNGYLSGGDWTTFNNKQPALGGTGIVKSTAGVVTYLTDNSTNWNTAYTSRIASLTTTGSSGASTLSANVLNIPNYTLTGLGGQPLDTGLTSLSSLSYISPAFVKMTGVDTFTLDTTVYENIANKSDSYTVSSSTTYASTKALVDGLATKANDATVVHLSGTETITGTKTFSASPLFDLGARYKTATLGYQSINAFDTGWLFGVGAVTQSFLFSGATGYNYTFPNATGTIALTSNLSAYQPLLTNPITGTGTTNYLPKFTGSTSLGNSSIFDNGTNVGIGTTSLNQLLSISSSSVGGSTFGLYNTASNIDNRNWALKLNANNYGDLGLFVSSSNGGNPESGSIAMLINKSGNLGLGTTSPSYKLHVQLGQIYAGSNYGFRTYDATNGGDSWQFGSNSGDFSFNNTSASTTPLTVKSGGNILIGTTTDSGDKLRVNGTVRLDNLAGTGTRTVVADASGNLSASATSTSTYKVYTALVTQSGTSAPTAIVLENTTGATITFARTGAGMYTATFSSAVLTTNKTTMSISSTFTDTIGSGGVGSTTVVNIYTTIVNPSYAFSDGRMSSSTFEVRIYN